MPPQSGTRPILTKAWMKEAERAAKHDVAGEREIGAGARRHAVHRAHDGLGQRAHALDERVVPGVQARAEVDRRADFMSRSREVGARRRSRGRRR